MRGKGYLKPTNHENSKINRFYKTKQKTLNRF